MKLNTTYKNILVIIAGLLIFFQIFKHEYFFYAALLISLLSLISSNLANLINTGWLKLALALGWVNSRILLSIVFYIFLTPIALISRLFNRDILMLKKNQNSLYVKREHQYNKSDLENMW
ncbi:MAG: SxtJ family membrane protein [Bacteroidota bacterium]